MNFLKVYKDQKEARALLESIAPISFAQIEGQLWTTTGEIDKWAGVGKAAQRLRSGMHELKEDPSQFRRVEDPEFGKDFAIRLGKPSGAFGAAFDMWGHISMVSSTLALIVLCCHDSDRASKLRFQLGLPDRVGAKFGKELISVIQAEALPKSWTPSQPVPAKAAVPQSKIEVGLSGLLQRCLSEEAKAREIYDRKAAEIDSYRIRLEAAIERTKAIVRATEIAEEMSETP